MASCERGQLSFNVETGGDASNCARLAATVVTRMDILRI